MNATANQTVISKGAIFDGKIKSADSVRIDGQMTGEVVSDATIEVGESGVVQGNLTAKHVITAGRIRGAISAAEKVELKGTSRLDGDLVTVRLVIEDGAQFEGMCSMGGKPREAGRAPAPAGATAPAPTSSASVVAKDAHKEAPKASGGFFGRKED